MYYKSLVFEDLINYDKTDKQCGPLSYFFWNRCIYKTSQFLIQI